jgi:hypothetical protein
MPTMTWNQLTPDVVTNLFLYGTTTKPSDLADDARIRPAGERPVVDVDAVSYMADGPGRFFSGFQVPVVSFFFAWDGFRATGVRQEFTVAQMMKITGGADNAVVREWAYTDSTDDHMARSYIWNSVSARLDPTAKFVIDPDGTRHIEEYRLLPYNTDFDFESDSGMAQLAAGYL